MDGDIMSIQPINIGYAPNDGLGDDIRTAFNKINANFTLLGSSLLLEAVENTSPGATLPISVVDNKIAFRKIQGGNNISIEELPTAILISTDSAFTQFDTNIGSISAVNDRTISLLGGDGVVIAASGSTITIDTEMPVHSIMNTFDFGPINGNMASSVQLITAAANIDFGTIRYPGTVSLDCGMLV
jgi:hypothetical protein